MYNTKEKIDYIRTVSRSVAQSINNQLYRNNNDYDDYYKLLLAVATREEDIERYRKLINTLRFHPLDDYIHSYLRSLVMKELNRTLASSKIARISAMDIEYKIPTVPGSWYNWSEIFSDLFKKPAVFGSITGEQGSGKTHCAIWMAEALTKAGIHVASNIDIHLIRSNVGTRAIEKYHHVTRLSDLMDIHTHNTVVFLDETGIHWSRRDNTTRKNKDMEKFVRLFRKHRMSLILIDQLYSTIPQILKEWSSIEIKRYRNHNTRIAHHKIHTMINELDLTTYQFETEELPPFQIDLDIEKYLGGGK